MALNKSVIPLKYEGVQTKVDPKTAPLGSFSAVENRDMDSFHELKQRPGQKILGDSYNFDGDLVGCYSLNREVGVYTESTLYSYSQSSDDFIEKGDIFNPIITSQPVISNTYTQSLQDSSISEDGKLGVIWKDSSDDGIYFLIKDSITGVLIVDKTLVTNASDEAPRIVAAKKYFYLFYTTGIDFGTVYLRSYSIISGELSSPQVFLHLGGETYTGNIYDVIKFSGDNILGVGYSHLFGGMYAAYWNTSTNTLGSSINGLPEPSRLESVETQYPCAVSACSIVEDSLFFVGMVYLDVSLGGIYFITGSAYSSDFSIQNPTIPVTQMNLGTTTHTTGELTQLTCKYVPKLDREVLTEPPATWTEGGDAVICFASIQSEVGTSPNTWMRTYCENFIAPYPLTYTDLKLYSQFPLDGLVYNLSLISTCFSVNNRAYSIYVYDSADISNSLQKTAFILRDDFTVVARINTKVSAGTIQSKNSLTRINSSPEDVDLFVACLLRSTRIVTDNTFFYTTNSIYSENILFYDMQSPYVSVENDLYFTNGFLKVYDGFPGIVEQGFHLYPEITGIKKYNPGLDAFPAGTYSYVCMWEWTDNTGQLFRSEPSVPVKFVSAGTTADWPQLTVLTLPVTNKSPKFQTTEGRSNAVLAVYRTLKNGTTYYRCNQQPSSWLYNDKYDETIVYPEVVSDTDLSTRTLLYTTGGVVSNTAIPVTNLMCLAKNRLVLIRSDLWPLRCYVSKEKQQGIAYELSEDLYVDIDPLGGYPTSIAAMDDKVVVFKQSCIFFFAGAGPDNTGNGLFTLPQLISSDVGCVNPSSVVLCEDGLMFKSLKGIYLLTRQLTTFYIGAPVDAYNSLTITSAANISSNNKIKFSSKEGTTLVFDTVFKMWNTYTNQKILGSAVSNTLWYTVNSEYNKLTVEDPNRDYDYYGVPILGRFTTNWISLAGVGGYQRIYTIRVIGKGQDLSHRLNCKLYYDYQGFFSEQLSITPSAENGPSYGTDSPYGSGTPYGSSNNGYYIYDILPRIQKCSAIKIELYDTFPDGERTKSFSLSEIVLEVGTKYGVQKISPARRLT